MVAAMTEEESHKITLAEADDLQMMSTMSEAVEVPMTMETRKGVLRIVAEAPKNLETVVGDLNLMESESDTTTTVKASIERRWGDIVIAYAVADVAK